MRDDPGLPDGAPRPRRSLILAGGGYKVAFQAGVLQVWLDEAGLEFDHADGASGRQPQPRDVVPGHERATDRGQLAQAATARRHRAQLALLVEAALG